MRTTIKRKILIGFIGMSVLLLLVSAISFYSLTKIDSSYSDLVNRSSKIISNVKDIESKVNLQSNALRGIILNKEDTKIKNFEESNQSVTDKIKETESLEKTKESKDLLNKLNQLNQEYYNEAEVIIKLAGIDNNLAYEKNTEITSLIREMRDLTIQIGDKQEKLMADSNNTNNQLVNNIKIIIIAISIFATVLSIIIGNIIANMISKPINKLAKMAELISGGDLTIENIEVKTNDEIKILGNAFNDMRKSLSELINEVGSSAEQVASSSEELTASADQTGRATEQIASAIEQIAKGTENQMAGMEQSSTALDEMTSGIQSIAENASNASTTANDTMTQAEAGSEIVNRTANQMININKSVSDSDVTIKNLFDQSQEIVKILEVIKGISDQTNLLALNAAIEAARAGEHGRGFAVVAEEVRKLAVESGTSAELIAELIKEIQEKVNKSVEEMSKVKAEVELGLKVTTEAEEKFAFVLSSMKEMNSQIKEISFTSQQMSASSQQVAASINEMTNISQESASSSQNVAAAAEEQLASMEEITSSASGLSAMAEELQTVIKKFKV